MLGSYSASPNPLVTEVIADEFPSGMMARGLYTVTSKVIDLDETVWLGAYIHPFNLRAYAWITVVSLRL